MSERLHLRRALPEDRERLHEIAAETPGLEFPKDVFAFPTVECAVVTRDDGEIVGFAYLEAIPEAHLVLRRRGLSRAKRRRAIELLHAAAGKVAEKLRLPAIRYPVRPELDELAVFLSGLPNVQGDPRTHLALVRPGGE